MVEVLSRKATPGGADRLVRLAAVIAFVSCGPAHLAAVAADAPLPPPQAVAQPAGLKSLKPVVAPTSAPAAAPTSVQSSGGSSAKTTTAPASPTTAAGADSTADMLAKLAQLEKIMFGASQPNIPLAYRLDRLESEVFHQTNPDWQPKARVDRLSKTLLGGGGIPAVPALPTTASMPSLTPMPSGSLPALDPSLGGTPLPPINQQSADNGSPAASPYLPVPVEAGSAEFTKPLSRQQLEAYGLELINEARLQVGLKPLMEDDIAAKVARDLVADLCKRDCVMHQNSLGENPDVRYTKAGGVDCMVESLASTKLKRRPIPNKALVYNLVKQLLDHQDDRDALLNVHASHFGFSFDISQPGDRIIACAETVVREGQVDSVPATVRVGEKIDIKGHLNESCKFAKITVAWEGLTSPPDDSDPDEEATPYFPPLDYEAYACHGEHDFAKAEQVLKITGMAVALAGGVFIPPVALAAPLIAFAPPPKPKALSEIPVHRGVHSNGSSFDMKLPLSKENKEGIYYITVWAKGETDQAPFAVSRRAVVATSGSDHATKSSNEKENVQIKARKAE